MSLAKKISEDVKSALKGGDKKKLSIARYIYSELKNFLIKENLDRDVIKLSDENVIKIIKTQLKQKKESLEFALQAKVQSKIDDLEFDINYLNNFLPTLMDDDSTKNIILDQSSTDQYIIVCSATHANVKAAGKCPVSKSTGLKRPAYLIEWSRFGNVKRHKWNGNDWIR